MQIIIEKSGPVQLGAYRDSVSNYSITLGEPIRYFSPEQLRQYIVGLAMAACERPGQVALSQKESIGFLQPYVEEVKQAGTLHWQVKIIHPYTD